MVYCTLSTVNRKIVVLFSVEYETCDPLKKYINV